LKVLGTDFLPPAWARLTKVQPLVLVLLLLQVLGQRIPILVLDNWILAPEEKIPALKKKILVLEPRTLAPARKCSLVQERVLPSCPLAPQRVQPKRV